MRDRIAGAKRLSAGLWIRRSDQSARGIDSELELNAKPNRDSGSRLKGLIFCVLWSGLVLLFDGLFLHATTRALYAQFAYVTTPGTVENSELLSMWAGRVITHKAAVTYSYDVDGKHYSGNRAAYDVFEWSSGIRAKRLVNSHAAHSAATVWYDPGNPAESTLEVGVNGAQITCFIFLLPFNAIMLMLWWPYGLRFASKSDQPALCERDDGVHASLRIFDTSTIVVVLGVAITPASFGVVLVLALGFGDDPSEPMALVGLAVVAVAGLAAGILVYGAGFHEVDVDRRRGVIILPRRELRRSRRILGFGEIAEIAISPTKAGKYARVHIVTRQHGTQPLGWRLSPELAEQVCSWLQKQIRSS